MAGGCDSVIGYGGGSSIDLGKAVAALLPNGGDPMVYLEVIGAGRKLERPSLPFIAIPTTAGGFLASVWLCSVHGRGDPRQGPDHSGTPLSHWQAACRWRVQQCGIVVVHTRRSSVHRRLQSPSFR